MYLRRLKILAIIMIVVMVAMLGRLAHLQIVRGDYHSARAKGLLSYTELIPTVRGRILDRNGKVLAYDKPCMDLCLDYRFMTGQQRWVRRTQRRIAQSEGISLEQAEQVYERRAEETWKLVHLATGLSRDGLQKEVIDPLVDRVEKLRGRVGMDVREQMQAHAVARALRDLDLGVFERAIDSGATVGASLRPSWMRWYPQGAIACHVIGLTNQVSSKDRERLKAPKDSGNKLEHLRTNYALDDTKGVSGVEYMCEQFLRGRRGYRQYRRAGLLESDAPFEAGKDVHLTIDIELQRELTGYIPEGINGCIVVMTLPDMQILAMVSVPVYDLNSYKADYAQLVGDVINHPLKHRAVGERYPPGSTVKPVAAIAALSSGTINPFTTYTCYGSLFPGGRGPNCWSSGHGSVDVVTALQNSCNVFFYHVGEEMGVANLSNWMCQFGLGDRTGTGLGAEAKPILSRRGTPGEARYMAIGQAVIAVTPLHVANMVATIATGELRSPQLVLEGGPVQSRSRAPGTEEAWRLVREGMYRVVNNPASETAYKFFHGRDLSIDGRPVDELDFSVCGKTGTAQTPRTVNGERIEENALWFACYAPRDKPRLAVAVMLERMDSEAGGGGKNCAPIARETLRLCQKLGYVK